MFYWISVFPGALDSIFGMNFRICPQYNSFLFFCRNSRLKALKQLQRKRGTLLYGTTLSPGKRLLGAGLLMALDVRLKQQEPETELSPFYQHLHSKEEQEDRPQAGLSISALSQEDKQEEKDSSSPRVSSIRSSLSLLPDFWSISEEFPSYRNAGAHHNTSDSSEIYWGTQGFSAIRVEKIWG